MKWFYDWRRVNRDARVPAALPMPSPTKSVDAKTAFELVFGLLQKNPWIVPGVSAPLPDIAVMKRHQAEAVNVILWICETGDLTGWPAQTPLDTQGHCCKVSDEAAFCLIQRPYISKTLLT
ncbi:hypothetical protein O9649_30380, partial [Achromobacter dolens]|nr:hypothetical protein [Achromobacter dolens]